MTLYVIGWLVISVLNLWAFLTAEMRLSKNVIVGDIVFYSCLSLLGPLAILATIKALFAGRTRSIMNRKVWPRD